ncbi:pyridoxamine 5'-phosphate oxidase family protein [Methylobacterium sp. NEAU 140]|uniref:pyridoxamine 5'-phosphate oxidase family protein n=1 Tax=Methylobacterium sp. NEAU 140 TaxID=3064945 RepID=UPI002735E752|nr:pyridoxamine 5'-phosphate oxidase family protein [Methylobacterium sp. NEAU 140]MDP4023506.1 pyridoxamine 5'-phosphate oxidase family protein [Methylobacterium sp. NEAU 140]
MSGFHADEVAAQALAGRVLGDLPALRPAMPDQHRAFFAGLPYLLVGVPDAAGAPLATLLAGEPGFVTAPDATHLRVDATPDSGDLAAPHLAAGAEIGLLGIDLSTRRRNRANGRIAARDAGGFTVAVAQSFGNCPQYIQRRDAVPADRTRGPTEALGGLDREARALIAAADTLFVASRSRAGLAGGGTDISHRGGRPGFVRVAGDALTVPDFAGNRYFNTLGNLLGEPRAGLLIPDFATGDLLILQGTAEIDWSGAGAAGLAGAQRAWRFVAERGWRRRAALPFRWSAPEPAPQLARTGTWAPAG